MPHITGITLTVAGMDRPVRDMRFIDVHLAAIKSDDHCHGNGWATSEKTGWQLLKR